MQGAEWSQNLCLSVCVFQISSSYLAKECLTPKTHGCQCDWGLAIKKWCWTLWQKQCWTTTLPSKTLSLEVPGGSWTEHFKQRAAQSAHGEMEEAIVFNDCWSFQPVHSSWLQGWGDIKYRKKRPNMINSSQNTQGFQWFTRGPLGSRVPWYQQL